VKIFCPQKGTDGNGKQNGSQQNDSCHSVLPANICNHLVSPCKLIGCQFSVSPEVEPLFKPDFENARSNKIDERPNQFQLFQQKREKRIKEQESQQTTQLNHHKSFNLIQPE